MACEILSGITCSCGYSASGVEKLWVANKSQVTGAVYNAAGELTGFTSGTTYNLFEICAATDSITFTDDLVVNGSRRNFLQSITFGLNEIDADILAILEQIGLSNLVAFIKDAAGNFRVFGLKSTGLRATVMTSASGTAAGNDGNISVTISGSSLGKGSFIDATWATTMGLS